MADPIRFEISNTLEREMEERLQSVAQVEGRDRIAIDVSVEEALVLFEWLTRTGDARAETLVDLAEQRALWSLEALLEREIQSVVRPDYNRLLDSARQTVRDLGVGP